MTVFRAFVWLPSREPADFTLFSPGFSLAIGDLPDGFSATMQCHTEPTYHNKQAMEATRTQGIYGFPIMARRLLYKHKPDYGRIFSPGTRLNQRPRTDAQDGSLPGWSH